MGTVLRRYCPVCKATVAAEKQPTNTALHVVLCLATAGLWIPVWIIWSGMKGYACRTCGGSTKSPMLRSLVRAVVTLAAVVGAIYFVVKVSG